MTAFVIDELIEKANTLPARFYTDPEIFEELKEKVFTRSWQFIADTNAVKVQGDMYPFSFLEGYVDEPLLFTKDGNEQLHCLSNVCTHRGNILVKNPTNGNRVMCGYHGRCFELDGSFRSMPETKGMENFPAPSDNLAKAPFAQWSKFLFASINPAFDFRELVDDMEKRIGWMPLRDFWFEPVRSQDYLVKANWALYVDNYLEGFHSRLFIKSWLMPLILAITGMKCMNMPTCNWALAKAGMFCLIYPPHRLITVKM